MSTKILDAYRLAPGMDPFEFVHRLRDVLDPVRDRLDAALAAEITAELVDRHLMGCDAVPPRAMPRALAEWRAAQAKLGESDWDHDPNRFTASIGRDPETGRLHLVAHCRKREYAEALDAMPELEDYSYWNNTDQPDGVTAVEWAARRDAWDRVMPSGTPYRTMLAFALRAAGDGDLRRFQNDEHAALVIGSAPARLQRARRILLDRGFSTVINARKIDPLSRGISTLLLVQEHIENVGERLAAELPELTWGLAFHGGPASPEAMHAADAETAALVRLIDRAGDE